MSAEIMRCDGCNVPMDGQTYRDHDCPAYSKSEYKNPLDHKMKLANWKVPGKVTARGRVIDGEVVIQEDPWYLTRFRKFSVDWRFVIAIVVIWALMFAFLP